jgi:SAM-dependent methyltransferase
VKGSGSKVGAIVTELVVARANLRPRLRRAVVRTLTRSPRLLALAARLQALADRIRGDEVPSWYATDNLFHSRLQMEWCHRPIVDLAVATLAGRGGNVLDLGCGNGALLRTLCRVNPLIDPFGIDREAGPIDHARLLLPRHASHFVQGDLFEDPRPWSSGRRYLLALLSPSRLQEAGPERAAVLLAQIAQCCDHLLLYTYSERSLTDEVRAVGLELLSPAPGASASLCRLPSSPGMVPPR